MLEQYAKKRDFEVTPEPGPDAASGGGPKLRFVIQKHAATRLHYDLRLEAEGVLKSWAVPKGPSLNPKDKRLAVHVEDHPLSYATFEGQIPKGEYGGGEVIVWDEGLYEPDDLMGRSKEEQDAFVLNELKKGKLGFTLYGKKLHGSWALVNTDGENWLLIKHDDAAASSEKDILKDDRSVRSDRTIEDIRENRPPKQRVKPRVVVPMLASETKEPFDNPDWTFELKLDGIRSIAFVDQGSVVVQSRNGKEITMQYPELVEGLRAIGVERAVLDGEIVMFDAQGRPSFQSLMERFHMQNETMIQERARRTPTVFYAFDILELGDQDLRGKTLEERRELLEDLHFDNKTLKLLGSYEGEGKALYKSAMEMGFEGIMAKRLDSRYQDGIRCPHWLKVKEYRTGDFLIAGFSKGEGSRGSTFGSLILAEKEGDGYRYVGNVGSGLDESTLKSIKAKLDASIRETNPFGKKIEMRVKPTWVEPRLWAEVRFQDWTSEKKLRLPVFLRLRPDLEVAPEAIDDPFEDPVVSMSKDVIAQLEGEKKLTELVIGPDKVKLTNLDKVIFPGIGKHPPITKREYLIYLAKVAKYMLPHLKDRPISLTRYPHGATDEDKFFQKHPDESTPKFVGSVPIYSRTHKKASPNLLCNNLATLIWFGQMSAIEIHPWYSRIEPLHDAKDKGTDFWTDEDTLDESTLSYPDFMVFDLDPYRYAGTEKPGEEPAYNERGFRDACEVALQVKEMLDPLGAKLFVKTTGKTGLHVYLPIIRNFDYDAVRSMAEAIGMQVMSKAPERVTMEWKTEKRTGKLFFDHNQNVRGKTLASIYSARPTMSGTVSMPVSWDELMTIVPTEYTIPTVPEMLEKQGDLWAEILNHKKNFGEIFGE